MIMWNRTIAILVLLFAITASAPGYAVAEPPIPDWERGLVPFDAVLYETTENLSMRALERGRRKATSELLGFARRGSALCPEALVLAAAPSATHCTLNATGTDNISLLTGLGNFGGDVEIVVQEVVDPNTGQFTPDSPEVVIAKGRFTGKMDFSPAIVGLNGIKLPYGTVDGRLSLDGFSRRVPFNGIFRLPFLFAPLGGAFCPGENAPLYLTDPAKFGVPPTFGVSCVGANEMAIGYPTVRFEISF